MARACPFGICDGTGFVVDETTRTSAFCRCREQVVAERQARSLRARIPKRYAGVSFDRPPVSDIRPAVLAHVRRFVDNLDANLDSGRGLWLFGKHGTGKTSLAMVVSKEAIRLGRTVAIYSLPRLLAEIRRTFDEDSELSQTELIDRLATVDLLHIDDVGAEQTSSWVLEQLYAVVNARYEAQKSVIITTNLIDVDEMAQQIGMRTVSRLEDMCDIQPVIGTDMRRQDFGVQQTPDDEPQPTVHWS